MSKNAEIIDTKPDFVGDVVLIEQAPTPSPTSGQPYGLLLIILQP